MYRMFIATAFALVMTSAQIKAQPVDLGAYVDAKGFLDVQALTCDQLRNTFQEDADYLATWYSGWYNGLAKKHFLDFKRGKAVEHEVIEYCKAHPEVRVIEAMAIIFRDERVKSGVDMK